MEKYLPVIFWLPFVIYSIILHEVAHGWVADKLGDPTARLKGRLTLNPVKHIDPFMTIGLPLLIYIMSSGRAIFGGAKPVPVVAANFRSRRTGMMLTALAGPATNTSIALVFVLMLKVSFLVPDGSLIQVVFANVVIWNVLLAMFNLLPVPPLDGSRFLAWIFPRTIGPLYDKAERFGMLIVMLIVFIRPVWQAFSLAFIYVLFYMDQIFGLPLIRILTER